MSSETTPVAVPVNENKIKSLWKSSKVRNGLMAVVAILGLLGSYSQVKSFVSDSAISSSEAAGKVGQKATVEMLVGSDKFFAYSGNHNLNDGVFPNQTFVIRVTGCKTPVAQKGQTVRATGTVAMYNNKPQLVVKAEDVKIVK